jgi:hypothetical protein
MESSRTATRRAFSTAAARNSKASLCSPFVQVPRGGGNYCRASSTHEVPWPRHHRVSLSDCFIASQLLACCTALAMLAACGAGPVSIPAEVSDRPVEVVEYGAGDTTVVF